MSMSGKATSRQESHLRQVSAFLRKQFWRIISAVVRLPYPAVPAEIHVFFVAVSLVLVLPVYAQRATGSGTDLAAQIFDLRGLRVGWARFSRPPVSTAHPSLRAVDLSSIVRPK